MFSLLRMPHKRTPSRIRARRREGTKSTGQENAERLTLAHLTIDRIRHEVKMDSQTIHLTPREFDLLRVLASQPGQVYRREDLLSQVWGKGIFVAPRTVDVHMAKLRQKLRFTETQPDLVETIWGVGYRIRGGSL
jgi:DNA-binding response OmpR family regulator